MTSYFCRGTIQVCGGHLAEAVGERPVHAERVAAVLERARGEPERGRQRAGLVLRAVAVGADAVVDRLAALEALRSEAGDQAGVVDVVLVLGQGRRRRAATGRAAARGRAPARSRRSP